MKLTVVAFLVLIIALFTAAAPAPVDAQAWQPPIGIPAPPFGVVETPGPATHYVDNTHPASTDSGNPNGTPSVPRRTIPSTLPAGSVVEVRGGPYTGNGTWTGNGTQASPVFIKGVGGPVFSSSLGSRGIQGAFFVVDGLVFDRTKIGLGGARTVLRNSVVANFTPGGHNSAVSVQATDAVIYNNEIHHNGNASGASEIDVHGIKPDTGVSRLWILDNHIHDNGGDGVQVGNSNSPEPWAQFIYIGRNIMHGDRENAVDLKRSRDVIVSQNTMHGYRATNSSNGAAAVVHDSATRIWFLANHIFDSEFGIWNSGPSTDYYVIGNLIHSITSTAVSSSSLYSPGHALVTYETTNMFFVNNTIWDVSLGISSPNGSGRAEVVNNIVGGLRSASHHVAISRTGGVVVSHNLIGGPPRFKTGVTPQQTINADPLFANAAGGDFHLTHSSPAIEAGTDVGVTATFLNLYGLSIAADIVGSARPQGARWDIGAFEAGGPGGGAPPPGGNPPPPPVPPAGTPPNAPTNLRVN